MVLKLNSNTDLRELYKLLKQIPNRRIGNKRRFFGAIKWSINPLAYQKNIRKEWS